MSVSSYRKTRFLFRNLRTICRSSFYRVFAATY